MSTPVMDAPPYGKATGRLPDGVAVSHVWRHQPGGELVKHPKNQERPVNEETDLPVGEWWSCPTEGCRTGEWVFPEQNPDATPKQKGCSEHIVALAPPTSEVTPLRQRASVASWTGNKARELTAAPRAAVASRAAAIRAQGRADAEKVTSDLREHVPSAATSAAWLTTGAAVLGTQSALEAYAVASVLTIGGTVIAYVLAVFVQKSILRRRALGTRKQQRARARWIALGPFLTGVWLATSQTWLTITENLDAGIQYMPIGVFGLLLTALGNNTEWTAMAARRRAEAEQLRAEAERVAAELEEEKRRTEDRQRRERERAEVQKQRDEAHAEALAEYTAWRESQIWPDDTPVVAGQKFAAMYRALQTSQQPPFPFQKTAVVPEKTRPITAPDAAAPGGRRVVGWEFGIKFDPGVNVQSANGAFPFSSSLGWVASMLGRDVNGLALIDQAVDGEGLAVPNFGTLVLSDGIPLSEPVSYPGRVGVRIKPNGAMIGFLGRDLLGQPVEKTYHEPGRASGGGCVGRTGTGKTVVTLVDILNMLYLGIFPMVWDGKELVDYADFRGIIPLGATIEHRDVFFEAQWGIMTLRRARLRRNRGRNRNGIIAMKSPVWKVENGAPLHCIWDEFHINAKDRKFSDLMSLKSRLQRQIAMADWVKTQGGGLTDFADDVFRGQLNDVCLELMRMSEHQARLAGFNGSFSPADLPRLPGMMVRQTEGSQAVPLRAAYVHQEDAPGSVLDHLYVPDAASPTGGRLILPAVTLPDEELEVFARTGVQEIWDLGKTEDGWDGLLAASDPVTSTASAAQAGLHVQRPAVDGVKPRLKAAEVCAALLAKHPQGLGVFEMLDHEWWNYTDGPWSKTASGAPDAGTISKALNVKSEDLAKGVKPIATSDGGKPAVWQITPHGHVLAQTALAALANAGAPGLRTEEDQAAAAARERTISDIENEALSEAERDALIAAEVAAIRNAKN